jgi:predicted alpha/beta superfamily hydrolase
MPSCRKLFAGAFAAALSMSGAAVADAPAASDSRAHAEHAEVFIRDTRRIDFVSKVNGHAYSMEVSAPEAPAPPGGYPVIYVIDGNGYFPSVVGAVRMNGNAPQAVVVGIGYPRDPAWIATEADAVRRQPAEFVRGSAFEQSVGVARIYDLTLPVTADQAKAIAPSVTPGDFGGLDDFVKTIETEVKPRLIAIAQTDHVPLDLNNQTLFGHSLGGLAVVDALFTEPKAFRTFVAASPSIWWANKAVLDKETAFKAEVASGAVAPRILITVGGEEETVPKLPPAMAAQQATVEAEVKMASMITNACALAGRLKALHGAAGYEVADCAVFPGQAHGISVWPAIGRAVSFAFPQ